MSRPSAEDVEEAARVIEALLDDVAGTEVRKRVAYERVALHTLREAAKPRYVWPSKEVCEALRVTPANLSDVRGLPAPAQELPRPTSTHPKKTVRYWWVDEIEEFRPVWLARKGGGG